MASTYDAIVIGASINGLVAAAALGKAGKRVLLVDGSDTLGAEACTLEFAPGFRAAPFALDAGWLPPGVASGVRLKKPRRAEPEYAITVATDAGRYLTLSADATDAAEAIRDHSVRDAKNWPAFVARLRKLSGFLEALYQVPAPDIDASSLRDILPLIGLGRKLRGLGRADTTELLRALPMSVQDFLDDHLESDAVKAAVGAGGVRDVRQGPRSGGTTYNLLHYMAGAPAGSVRGTSWWKDGPDALTTELERVARKRGVTIQLGRGVARVIVRDDTVSGVVMDDAEEIFARVVLSTEDPARTLLHLIDPVWLDPEFVRAVGNIRFRGCTSVVLYALDKLPDVPGLDGVVSLTPTLTQLERAFDAAKYGRVSESPHVELTAPSLRWPGLAPEGKHVVVARVQYDGRTGMREGGWGKDVANAALSVISRHVPRFADSIVQQRVLTPHDIEAKFGLTQGALSHGEVALDQILFMRPVAGSSRYAMPIEGLYLGGAGAHPGPGILGSAGWLASRQALRDKRI